MRHRLVPWILVAAAVAAVVVAMGTPGPEDWVQGLGADTAEERDEAATRLLALGQGAVPVLEEAVRSGDLPVRVRAAAILTLLREDPAVAISARDGRAARLAAEAVTDPARLLGDPEFDERLHELMPASGDALAAAALDVPESRLVPEPLARALVRHPSPRAIRTLAELARQERLAPSAVLRAARDAEEAGLFRTPHGPLAADHLRPALAAPSPPRRRTALALFGALAGDAGHADVASLSGDPDCGVREEVARTLGRIAPGRSLAALQHLCLDRSPAVRAAALDALARVPGRPRTEPALAALDDPAPPVRAAAVRLLSLGDPEPGSPAAGALLRLTADDSPRVRAAARRALGAIAERTALGR